MLQEYPEGLMLLTNSLLSSQARTLNKKGNEAVICFCFRLVMLILLFFFLEYVINYRHYEILLETYFSMHLFYYVNIVTANKIYTNALILLMSSLSSDFSKISTSF